jgi:hypothetical protein
VRDVAGLPRRGLIAALVVGLVWPLPALAYRPFNGTDAAVAGKGELELELGPLGFVKEGANETLVAPSAILNWGFADRLELVLEGRNVVQLGNETSEPRARIEDIALSLKSVLREGSLQEKTGVSVATELSALLPATHGESGTGAELAVIASQRWPDLTVHLNGAAAWTRAHRLGLFGGAIFEVHDTWAVRPVAEVFAEGEHDQPTVVSGLVGAIWRVRENLSFDTGLRVARGGGVTTTEVRAGLTWGLNLGFPAPRH